MAFPAFGGPYYGRRSHYEIINNMGTQNSKEVSEGKMQIIEESSGFRLMELHFPSVMSGMTFLIVAAAVVAAAVWLFRRYKKHASARRQRQQQQQLAQLAMLSGSAPPQANGTSSGATLTSALPAAMLLARQLAQGGSSLSVAGTQQAASAVPGAPSQLLPMAPNSLP